MKDGVLFVGHQAECFDEFLMRYSKELKVFRANSTENASKIVDKNSISVCVCGSVDSEEELYFLRWATTRIKGAVYCKVIKTGDTKTATRAVNENRVSSLILSDVSVNGLKGIIDSAILEYHRRKVDKMILHDTFTGSINILLNLTDRQPIQFVNGSILSDTVRDLFAALHRKANWEVMLAARICTVGLLAMTTEEIATFYNARVDEGKHKETVDRLFKLASEFIGRIPRLSGVSEILADSYLADGWISASTSPLMANCNFLRVAFYWNLLSFRGYKKEAILMELKRLFSNLSEGLLNAADGLDCQLLEQLAVIVPLDELIDGMVSAEEIYDEDGGVIVSRGRRLTPPLIQNLVQLKHDEITRIKIVAGSCPVLVDDAYAHSNWV